jgi:hypothetical protein
MSSPEFGQLNPDLQWLMQETDPLDKADVLTKSDDDYKITCGQCKDQRCFEGQQKLDINYFAEPSIYSKQDFKLQKVCS